jgi:hypothetical protein
MNLANAAREVIRLSRGVAAAEPADHGTASREMHTSGGNDAAGKYLKTLPEDVVMKLLALTTMGKDKNPNIHRIYDDLRGLTRDKTEAIRGMTSKVPLAEYLEKGLKIAAERGIDLEAEF